MGLYFPGTQAKQLPSVPDHPALHMHTVTAVLPAADEVFAGQAAHSPVPRPYVPALHSQMPDTGIVELAYLPHNMHVVPSPR